MDMGDRAMRMAHTEVLIAVLQALPPDVRRRVQEQLRGRREEELATAPNDPGLAQRRAVAEALNTFIGLR